MTTTKRIGIALATAGLAVAALSAALDLIGLGKGGIQAAQILAILAGLLTAVFGASLARFYPESAVRPGRWVSASLARLAELPVSLWVFAAFTLVYLAFFLWPVFFNADLRMRYYNRYLPDAYPIGMDLSITTNLVEDWVRTRQSPYPHEFYPPLAYILQAPLVLLRYPGSYVFISLLTVGSYLALGALVPGLSRRPFDRSLLYLVLATGLFSYGLQFELERGQFNLIAFLMCMASIYIFHRHHAFRYLAYVMFSFAVHLKIYPAIFAVLLVRDWRDWKANLRRLAGLALFNVALLFTLGYQGFLGFFEALLAQLRDPGWTWNGNHSIHAFVFNLARDGYGLLAPGTLAGVQEHAATIERLLLGAVLLCFGAILYRSIRANSGEPDPTLLLVCTLAALVIPTSNDYTLPVLVAPAMLYYAALSLPQGAWRRPLAIVLVFTGSAAYFSLLYPFKYRPYFLNSSFPALFTMLLAVSALGLLAPRPPRANTLGASPAGDSDRER